jgi:4'-phosphopantetheinyl transferase
VRTTLSRYADLDPRRWRFRQGAEGRPEIDRQGGLPPLRFNLSHTRGLVACVVTLGFDCGVDVEHPGRQLRDPLALARHSFAPVEQRALEGLDGEELRRRFFDLWTLKEAYVKARGAGFLSLPARRFAWEIDGGELRLTIGDELADAAEAWQALLVEPRPGYRLAAAIRRGRRPDLALAAWEVAPLGGEPRAARPELVARSAPAVLAPV